MSISVTMPALGESVTEGTVTRWLKQEGEQVNADEPLLEVSTDKVDTEIPSPASGVLTKIVVAEDETVAVGTELAVIGGEGDGDPSGSADGGQQADQAAAGQEQQSAGDQSDGQQPAAAEQQPTEQQPAEQQPAEQQAESAATERPASRPAATASRATASPATTSPATAPWSPCRRSARA